MKILDGVNALAPFKQNQLLENLKQFDKNIISVYAEYVHFIDCENLSAEEETKLNQLLSYDEPYKQNPYSEIIFSAPRPGTISPWSSKATDIAKNCNLENVRRIERGVKYYFQSSSDINFDNIRHLLHDRMTQILIPDLDNLKNLFSSKQPKTFSEIDIKNLGENALNDANKNLGLALSKDEISYLLNAYSKIDRNPTDAELMMFSVVNSEHCRHKIFNADWIIDGRPVSKSLFKMIKNTYEKNNSEVLSAYSDNAAVLKGPVAKQFFADPETKKYGYHEEPANLVIKVETHNHPTAIAPFPGASTGVGGEIRDEAATGRGARSKMGLTGFNVSNLKIPDNTQPWEVDYGKPNRISSALEIMTDAPLGGSGFSNEFGRPNILGYFRTYEQIINDDTIGYHKPIMLAGGLGNIRDEHVLKSQIKPGDKLIVLGGPSMLIGLGGGSASSLETGKSIEDLDFASVQRDNAEMQRRAQEVISSCWALGNKNPIISIHDVGAGGISNALPELIHDNNLGAIFELRDIPNAEPSLSPMEIWCNEAQERFVLAINPNDLKKFEAICSRERCPFAVVGIATQDQNLILNDSKFNNKPINIPLDLLFGNPPKMTRQYKTEKPILDKLNIENIDIKEATARVLTLPTVASKKFLITIGDRTVTGLVARDQMIGKWQVPVSDVAVTSASYYGKDGEAVAIGERPPVAIINAAASARLAVGEAITNIAAASIENISKIKLSANWMAAAGYKQNDQYLHEAVEALGEDFCPELGICIPVGKDSLSMRTNWIENDNEKSVSSPLSLVISAFAPTNNVTKTLTPELKDIESKLILIDLGSRKNRLGGSALAQVYNQIGNECPDVSAPNLKNFFESIQELNKNNSILSYHDRSDGGLFTSIAEMMFASRLGLNISLDNLGSNPLEILFNEELGAVIQVKTVDLENVLSLLESKNIFAKEIGSINNSELLEIHKESKLIYKNSRIELEKLWAKTSFEIQKLRDNPETASEEFELIEKNDPGLSPKITFSNIKKSYKTKPKVAVLREQGVNGHVEMAAAFERAGFEAIDVHLCDFIKSDFSLDDYRILAVCGGFSYGDVLGAGNGFNKSILFNETLRNKFKKFFERKDTLTLGVCNGCQVLSGMKDIIPGATHWPELKANTSGRFEARLVSVKINDSPSVFFDGMEGSIIPVPVAHGEGKAVFKNIDQTNNIAVAQFVDNFGKITESYPLNPNGSSNGITAVTSQDGRATIMMPHPERAILAKQFSWHPDDWEEESPWLRIFQNARKWIEDNNTLD